ncbi:hypothetical protein AQUCO_01800081v1 [Aquilegia coerulea]|uniref:Uncharacterized protein n=1 Tax=Aquilegia coerulea TaxID=218851 RepID=A0A2G5DJU4_AQUCA|nr:hypothetical protein AQUCO_01800081v1 [Aquilegia coerulea]PIA43779.1 hypothetical protein AQUCO_01800081v1 [Aquilegia coerulea]PIA43780.1 hypothetical protein AQUCO_01800081v1 [Aquilegia coerulea]
MARILSQTLIRVSILSSKSSPASSSFCTPLISSRLVNHRSRSNISEKGGNFLEIDLDPTSTEEVIGMRRLEDAIHGIIVKRSAPDWLPFIPGSSYWVPPRKRPYGIVELIGKLANPLTEEETLSLSSNRGFPCSDYFVNDCIITGASPYPVEMERNSEKESQSEDEEE